MDKSALPFLLIIGGYLAFEIYGVHSSKHLMEAGHIYGKYVAAEYAVERCESAGDVDRAQFANNLQVMRRKAQAQLAEADPEADADTLAARLQAIAADRRAEIDALIANESCDGKGIFTQRKTFEQSARLRLQ